MTRTRNNERSRGRNDQRTERSNSQNNPAKADNPDSWQSFGASLAERQSHSASSRLNDRVHALAEKRMQARLTIEQVRDAREMVKGWKPTTVSPDTRNRYAKLTNRMERTGKQPEQMAGTPAAFRSYRAAAVFKARSEIKAGLSDRDKTARAGDQAAKAQSEIRISAAMAILDRYPPGTGDPRKDMLTPSRYQGAAYSDRSTGKKNALASRPADWRDRVWQEINPRDRDAVAVMALTGARPAELEKGIKVRSTPEGLTCRIQGAKLGDNRGQQERTITLTKAEAKKSAEGRHLMRIREGTERTAQVGSANALTQRLERAGVRAGIHGEKVSAYDYRHAFSSRMKADDRFTPADRATALGQQVERSAEAYGSRSSAGVSGGSRISSASASSATR